MFLLYSIMVWNQDSFVVVETPPREGQEGEMNVPTRETGKERPPSKISLRVWGQVALEIQMVLFL